MRLSNRIFGSVLVLALLPAIVPSDAQAFTTRAGVRVNPVDASVFEVVPRGGRANYWCSASEYARRVLGAGWRAEVYIARGLGPSVTTGRRSAVQFTLEQSLAGGASAGGFKNHNTLKTGESMSVQRANNYCNKSTNQF